MRILIEGKNERDYLAKCHEAFRTGLRAQFGAHCYGRGYPGYTPFVRSFQGMINHCFAGAEPDLVISFSFNARELSKGIRYKGIELLAAYRAIYLCDFWSEAADQFNEYVDFILRHKIDFVLSFFPQPLTMWKDSALGPRLRYIPPTFDPAIFNDWLMPKQFDVGFLAAGTAERSDFYPERHSIHQRLLKESRLKYLWSSHPGWQPHKKEHPLVGRNFSKAINSCRIFITTGGIYRNPQPKIFEALASKTLLMSDEPVGADFLGLEDGVNYVKITEETVMDKIDYYLSRPELCDSIAESGYRLAMRRHSCFARAMDLYDALKPCLEQGER